MGVGGERIKYTRSERGCSSFFGKILLFGLPATLCVARLYRSDLGRFLPPTGTSRLFSVGGSFLSNVEERVGP